MSANENINAYVQGQTIELRGEVFDTVNQINVDPSVVVCKVKKGNGVVIEVPVTRQSLGVYTATVTADKEGFWTYRFEGQGLVQSVDEGTFYVRKSGVV